MEEDTSEADPLQLLSQFDDAPLHIEESFDLVLPSELEPITQNDNQPSAKKPKVSDETLNIIEEVLLDSDDEEEAAATNSSGNQSILAHLLNKPSSTPSASYTSSPAAGLSTLAQTVPNVTVFNISKPSSPVRKTIVPDQTINMRLLCVADVEFDLSAHFQAKHNIPKHSTFYTMIVFNLGSLFLPRNCLVKRKPFLQRKLSFVTRWCKENAERKSHDTILFTDLNLLVQKPGKANEVFTLLEKENAFFLGPNCFIRVSKMYYHQYYGEATPTRSPFPIMSDLQFSRVTQGLRKENSNRDVNVLVSALTVCRLQEKSKLLQDFKPENLQIPRRKYKDIGCQRCGRIFKQMSELLYHRFLCFKPSEEFDLVKILEEFSVPKLGFTQCSLCLKGFESEKYCYLHFDSHVHRGPMYPCYLCGKIFLTSWSFIRHHCLKNRKLPRKYCHDPSFKTPAAEIYSQLSPVLRNNVLKCPVCEKQCEFMSQLLSHIHIGSNCLQQLVNAGMVKVAEADLSIDLSPVLGVPEADRDKIIQCSSCK